MELRNQTFIIHFILIGFSQNFKSCILQYIVFLVFHILTILGNSFLILSVIVSPQLHTPMYYFLCNLSFLDMCCSFCSVPKFLFDLFLKKRKISVIGCLIQMNINLFLGATECILLAVMAYDRYVAICLPLRYTTIMNWRVCRHITAIMWSGSFLVSTVPTMVRPLVFCKENALNHFTCEVLALLEVACGDLSFYKIMIVAVGFFTLLSPLVFIMVSYICIIISILKIHSVHGRSKAFSTCASHLTVVLMLFITLVAMYMGQAAGFSSYLKYISLVYILFIPLLNPLIYSLRNSEVLQSIQKLLTTVSVIHRKT